MIEPRDISKLNVEIDKIENELILGKRVSLSILRLDKIHPEVSGNKFFKLYFFLEEAIASKKKIITFGGAYSNHLVATASACKMFGINSIGIVRGEESKDLSHTLLFCKQQGMGLEFISRANYRRKEEEDFKIYLRDKFGDHILIPEGGYCKQGVNGAVLISDFYRNAGYTHICCAVGTATTFAGLLQASLPAQKIIGFSALRELTDFEKRIQSLLGKPSHKKYFFINNYDFGGYAKNNNKLISFMNMFYETFNIPTDFVYTGKMMFGIFDLIQKKYFEAGSNILCIHTGGLQGNFSLPPGRLNF